MQELKEHIVTKKLVPQLRFKEFDGEWEDKKLGDVLKITSAARVHKDEWTEKGIPFFRTSDVVAYFKGTNNTKAYIPLELYESLSNKIGRVKKDDLLITGGGSIGIPYLIKNNDPLYFKDADLLWLKNTNQISGYFLYSFLITQLFRKYLKRISHIGTIAHYTVIQAKNTPCQFPSLPEQQKLASFLSAVDEKIQQLTKKKELLEQYKKGVMQQLFSGQLRFKNENGNAYPDWVKGRFSKFIKLDRGSSPRPIVKYITTSNDGVNWIKIGDTKKSNNYRISSVSEKITNEGSLKSRFVEKGEIILANSMSFGKSYLLEISGCIYDGWFVLRNFESSFDKFFLLQVLNSENLQRQYIRLSTGGVVQNINSDIVYSTLLFCPCLEEQQKIATYLSSIDTKIESVNNQITQTQTFKKGLLQQMFV